VLEANASESKIAPVRRRAFAALPPVDPYTRTVPKLWSTTIESHRREVREAILDATGTLATERGLLSVTMSQIADDVGIGRATLYKYFPDVDTILLAWHERQVSAHLAELATVRDRAGTAGERLAAVLRAYALIEHEHHGAELAELVHRGEHVARAHQELHAFVRDLVADAAAAGEVRGDVAPDELASYCIHAVGAASTLPTKAAVRRLVGVVLAGLLLEGR
jgi:AcrR family transcriptional regulator